MRPALIAALAAAWTVLSGGCGVLENILPGSSDSWRGGAQMKSWVSKDFPEEFAQRIASDIVERLKSGYPPGQTSLHLTVHLSAGGDGALAQTVEDLLRASGFTILPEPSDKAVTVSWRVDRLDEGVWYLTVQLSSGYRFARAYTLDGSGLRPAGGLSQGAF